MSYFVIGVSGVTCGGKTTLTKLLQRSFPWCRIVHQDFYFYDDEHPSHVRVPEVENHVNYELLTSMDMNKMHKDISAILAGPGEFFDGRTDGPKKTKTTDHDQESRYHQVAAAANSRPEDAPNFDTGLELLKTVGTLDFDTTKYKDIPILIIEGFIMFASQFIYDKCDVRFFVTLEESECRLRRSTRQYNPPDCPGYFEKIVWPEYNRHIEQHVANRPGIKVFDGTMPIKKVVARQRRNCKLPNNRKIFFY